MGVGHAEKLNEEPCGAVAYQVQAGHLVVEGGNAAQVVERYEQKNAFEKHFVELARVVEHRRAHQAVLCQREPHADGAGGHFAKKFPVDEVAPAAPGVGEGCQQKAQVQGFPQVHLVALDADDGEYGAKD